jgi:hypothetical protein
MNVYPAEAKINGVSEKVLAERWAKNLETRLPKATPCSKLPPSMLGYGKPAAGAVAAKPTAAQAPVKSATAKPVVAVKVAAVKPVAAKPAVAKPVFVSTPARPVSTMTGNESGALLLIVDALRTSRELNDQDWAAQKESLAKSLYSDLSYYLTGKGAAPSVTIVAPVKPAAKPVAKPAAKPVAKPAAKPVVAVTKPVVKPVVKPATKPVVAVTKPVVKPVVKPATKPVAVVKPADASMVKVPQKNRIRAKFAASKSAYDKLAASDPQAAAQVSALLSASRQAFAYGNFDESEKQVDAALSTLGVTFTGQ